MLTERLELRLPEERDRERFVELFGDDDFMVFSGGALSSEPAHARFDRMLERAAEVPFAKQPIIERSSGVIVGYVGVDRFDFEGASRLEFGYRLVPAARGRGYATEAGCAVLDVAAGCFTGELIAMIDPRNAASSNVITKLGFTWWKRAIVDGFEDDIYRRPFG